MVATLALVSLLASAFIAGVVLDMARTALGIVARLRWVA